MHGVICLGGSALHRVSAGCCQQQLWCLVAVQQVEKELQLAFVGNSDVRNQVSDWHTVFLEFFFWLSGHSESISSSYFVSVVFTFRHWCFLAYWNVGAEPIQIITHRHLHRNGIGSAESQSWHLCCRLFQDAAIKIWVWKKVLSQPCMKMYLAEAGAYRPVGVGGDPLHPQQQISSCTAEH